MGTMVSELFEALRRAGVDEALARAAAAAVLGADFKAELATRLDIERLAAATKLDIERLDGRLGAAEARLEAKIAETKADIIRWNVGLLALMTAIFAAIVRLG